MKTQNAMMDKCEEMKNAKKKMMKHMMEHMEKGKESISKCPMMENMDEKSDGTHPEHHEKSE